MHLNSKHHFTSDNVEYILIKMLLTSPGNVMCVHDSLCYIRKFHNNNFYATTPGIHVITKQKMRRRTEQQV